VIARMVAQKLQANLGGTFIVENKPGAGGRFAPDTVAKSPADGYTLLVAVPGAITIGPAIWSKLSYNVSKDFVPISLVSASPMVVVVPQDHPAKNIKELIAWTKANPDKANYPTPSPLFTLAIENFKAKSGATGAPISYRSSNDCAISLLGGQTSFGFIETTTAMPLIRDKKLRPLAVTVPSRIADLPDVPTLEELGISGVFAQSWFGILAPAGTPRAIVKKLEDALRQLASAEDFKTRLKAMSIGVIASSAEEFSKELAAESKMWSDVAKSVNMKFE